MADWTTKRVTDDPDAVCSTFMFADIAGFTALTEAHGDEQAARLVADFCDVVGAEPPMFGATQIRTIGDALMLRIENPRQAVLLGLRIAHDALAGHGVPTVRRRSRRCVRPTQQRATRCRPPERHPGVPAVGGIA